jgi:hypothetical protein
MAFAGDRASATGTFSQASICSPLGEGSRHRLGMDGPRSVCAKQKAKLIALKGWVLKRGRLMRVASVFLARAASPLGLKI